MKKTLVFLIFSGFVTALLAQVDTVPPTLVCKTFYQSPPSGDCGALIYATDVLDTVFDNVAGPLTLGIRRVCAGSGFPENMPSLWEYSGFSSMEVWAKDAAGNSAFCACPVWVYDAGNCDFAYSFSAETMWYEALGNTIITVNGNCCSGDTVNYQATLKSNGTYFSWGTILPSIGCYGEVTASRKMNPTNGVTTYDLVLIQKHILGIEALDSPYKLIAADANLDSKVTTSDIVLLRKLLLGIIPELPHGESWRFLPLDYVFPNPSNPFNPMFPDRYIIPTNVDILPGYFDFLGLKIGDVNQTADPNN